MVHFPRGACPGPGAGEMKIVPFGQIQGLTAQVHIALRRQAFSSFLVQTRTIRDHELVLVLSGEGIFTVEGRPYSAEAGRLFYFYPGLTHACATSDDRPLLFFAVHFGLHYGDGDENCRLPLDFYTVLKNPAPLKKLFAALYEAWIIRREGFAFQAGVLLQQIIFEILRDCARTDFSFQNARRAELLLAYIEENYHKSITVKDLCAVAGVGSTALHGIFRQLLGERPMAYINGYRMRKAKELLWGSGEKIGRLCARVGIEDVYYFSRLFKKLEGVSPAQYRRLGRGL